MRKRNTEIPPNISRGAKAEINGERIAADPRALNTAKVNQKIRDIPTAIPIPKRVPLLPIKNENGIAIMTIIRLEKGNAYL